MESTICFPTFILGVNLSKANDVRPILARRNQRHEVYSDCYGIPFKVVVFSEIMDPNRYPFRRNAPGIGGGRSDRGLARGMDESIHWASRPHARCYPAS
jgi:hypothetical protein